MTGKLVPGPVRTLTPLGAVTRPVGTAGPGAGKSNLQLAHHVHGDGVVGVAQLDEVAVDRVGGGALEGGEELRLLLHDAGRLGAEAAGGADAADLDGAVGGLDRGKEVVAAGVARNQVGVIDVDDDVGAEQRADDGLAPVVVARHQPGGAGQVRLGGHKGRQHLGAVQQDQLAAAQLVAVGAPPVRPCSRWPAASRPRCRPSWSRPPASQS